MGFDSNPRPMNSQQGTHHGAFHHSMQNINKQSTFPGNKTPLQYEYSDKKNYNEENINIMNSGMPKYFENDNKEKNSIKKVGFIQNINNITDSNKKSQRSEIKEESPLKFRLNEGPKLKEVQKENHYNEKKIKSDKR